MASLKQHIYCRLMQHAFVRFRAEWSWVGWGSWWWLLRHRRAFRASHALADLLHNMPWAILEPEFGPDDVGFVNSTVPYFLRLAGGQVEPQVAGLLLALYEAIPSQLREQLTWHPSEEFGGRSTPGKGTANHPLHHTDHATDDGARHDVFSRVSRQVSGSFAENNARCAR